MALKQLVQSADIDPTGEAILSEACRLGIMNCSRHTTSEEILSVWRGVATANLIIQLTSKNQNHPSLFSTLDSLDEEESERALVLLCNRIRAKTHLDEQAQTDGIRLFLHLLEIKLFTLYHGRIPTNIKHLDREIRNYIIQLAKHSNITIH